MVAVSSRSMALLLLVLVTASFVDAADLQVTVAANTSVATKPLAEAGGRFFVMSQSAFRCFAVNSPSSGPLWTFALTDAFCCVNLNNCANGRFLPWGDASVVVGCGPSLALLNASTGAVLSRYSMDSSNGDVALLMAVTGPDSLVVVLTPSARILSFSLPSWTVLWSKVGNPYLGVIVSGVPSQGITVVLNQTTAFNGTAVGYNASNGATVWTAPVLMWSREGVTALPLTSTTTYAWCGPEFQSLRIVDLLDGAYRQYLPGFAIQFVYPTDAGLVLIASTTTAQAINASTGTTLWSRDLDDGFHLVYMRASFDGDFVTLYADQSSGPRLNVVLATADGSVVATAGVTNCGEPTVARVDDSTIVVANCTGLNTATLMLYQVGDHHAGVVVDAMLSLVSVPGAPIGLQYVASGLVAVTTSGVMQLLRFQREGPASSPATSITVGTITAAVLSVALVAAFAFAALMAHRNRPQRRSTAAANRRVAKATTSGERRSSLVDDQRGLDTRTALDTTTAFLQDD